MVERAAKHLALAAAIGAAGGHAFTGVGRRRVRHNEKGGLRDTGQCFWSVEPSGDWSADHDTGTEYARLYLDDARASGDGLPLGWIVADMIAAGQFTGVEAGFMHGVARAALERPRRA